MSSTQHDGRAERIDPKNKLLHRANVRRLEGEAIRDAILTASGRLNEKAQGPSVPVHLTPFMNGRGRPSESGPLDGNGRRSIYTEIRRNFLPPMMLAFDMPIPFNTVGRRNVSNVPAQALVLMNSPFVDQQAEVWAERTLREHPDRTVEERIDRLYRAALARPPSEDELAEARAFIERQGEMMGVPAEQRSSHPGLWADFCHVLFNVKEFIFLR